MSQQLKESALTTMTRNLKYLKKEIDKKGNVSFKKAKFIPNFIHLV